MSLLIVTLGVLLVLSAVMFGMPLLGVDPGRRPAPRELLYFAAIGLGFMLLEISLIQRFVLFLGYPTYSLSVVLFALLAFAGAGSLAIGRVDNPSRPLRIALALATALIGASAVGLEPLLRAAIGLPFALRVAVAILVLAPFGLLIGVAMPSGLSRLQRLDPASIPYAWGVNGITSVVASALGVTLAIHFGFSGVSLVAALCYAVALFETTRWNWAGNGSLRDGRGSGSAQTI
jgi:hypothetical protein